MVFFQMIKNILTEFIITAHLTEVCSIAADPELSLRMRVYNFLHGWACRGTLTFLHVIGNYRVVM